MKPRLTRRSAPESSGRACRRGLFVRGAALPAAPAAEIRDLAIISKQPDKYHGWPTVAPAEKRAIARLLLRGAKPTSAPSAAWN